MSLTTTKAHAQAILDTHWNVVETYASQLQPSSLVGYHTSGRYSTNGSCRVIPHAPPTPYNRMVVEPQARKGATIPLSRSTSKVILVT